MTDTIAEMIQQANDAGYTFNNLFQLQDGSWRCNLRSELKVPAYVDFGNGPDPVSAIKATIKKMHDAAPRPRNDPETEEKRVGDGLDVLGFLKKPAPYTDAESIAAAHADAAGGDDDLIGGDPALTDDLIG